MSDDAYNSVAVSSLKLKGGAGIKKKKKKRKDVKLNDIDHQEFSSVDLKRTPTEDAFLRVQEERKWSKLLQKASKTHKERIAEFNEKLASTTEHFDIQKVSWTK